MRLLIFLLILSGALGWRVPTAVAQSPSPTASPSPTPTISPSPSPQPINLQPSEVMACPTDTDTEWVEVFNPNPATASLENWKITDSANNTKTINTSIPGESFGIISWSGSLLNNTGDSLSLITATNQPLFTVAFGACVSGRSFVFYNEAWTETTSPTKGSANLYTNPHPSPSPSPLPTPTPSPTPVASPQPSPTPSISPAPTTNPLITTRPLPTTAKSSSSPIGVGSSVIAGTPLNSSATDLNQPYADTSLPLTHLPNLNLADFSFLASSSGSTSGQVLAAQNQAETHNPLEISDTVSQPPKPPRAGLVSVIMGGLVLAASSCYPVYESIKKYTSPVG
jgi:hypothetical protein